MSFLSDVESFPAPKKLRVDGNITALAGEFFVAAELLKRELQVSITFGNTKHIDLFAHNPKTGRNFTVQVKSLRTKNYFPIREIIPAHIYVFVILNTTHKAVQYFIVSGKQLLSDPIKFAYKDDKFSGLHAKVLNEFENMWSTFQNVVT